MIKRAVLYAALALVVLVTVGADGGWEGSAVIGRHGAFPAEGYYGGSNSFARNTVVQITNLETGHNVEVIIAARVSEPGVFITVSDEAGERLGMLRNVPARVRVMPVETRVLAPPTVVREQPFSPDPDLNPLAELADPDRPHLLPLPADEPAAAPAPPPPAPPAPRGLSAGVTRTAASVPGARAADGEDVGSVDVPRRPPAQPPAIEPLFAEQPFFAPQPAVTETNRMEEAVAAVRGRVPPKELHPPPRDDEVFTFLDVPRELAVTRPVDHPLAEASLPGERVPHIADRPAAESLGKIEQPRPPLIVELPPAEPPPVVEEPQPPVVIAENDDVILRLEPADPRPPETVAEPVPDPEEEPAPLAEPAPAPRVTVDQWALESLPLQAELERSSYYLQVGAYVSPRSARNAIDRIESRYPFTVTAAEDNDRTLYRVFIGPLSQDETGVVLYQLRARGYRDAFVRRGGA
ncbi:MAG: SPOR domain-containing protein [Spirochaetaceae bacterium]|nr:MAG: SPOR domain-containing protein [Spirochaetaceae bacterium]